MSEISYINITRDNNRIEQWYEITSSGLTHSCNQGIINQYLCPLMTNMFSNHRYHNNIYLNKNFGLLNITSIDSINNITNNNYYKILNVNIYSLDNNDINKDERLIFTYQMNITKKNIVLPKIINYEYSKFAQISWFNNLSIYHISSIILILLIIIYINMKSFCYKLKNKFKMK